MLRQKIHFISGLPRAGSTLLSAILRQNPRMHAAMSSPVGAIFNASLASMGAENEFAVFLNEEQKRRILHGIFDGFYGDHDPEGIIFDTNRMWTSRLPTLKKLFPQTKVVCLVRNPAWVLDSVERLVRKNAFDVSRMFNNANERSTVYSRAEALLNRNRMIGFAWSALKEAYYGAEADMMLLVEYDILASRPDETLRLIYQFIGEPMFQHDFDNVEYEAEEFDSRMLVKDLHTVRGKVEFKQRPTILPPDLFEQFSQLAFWNDSKGTRANRIVAAPTNVPLA